MSIRKWKHFELDMEILLLFSCFALFAKEKIHR